MKYKKILLIVLLTITLAGCGKEKTDAIKFKEEYEQYNNKYQKLEIDEDNIIKYADKEKINSILKKGTGVIFIGSPKDEKSRYAIDLLLNASFSTDLNVIYYNNSLKGIDKLEKIEGAKIPMVVNVLKGKITSYHIGTIDDDKEKNEIEEIALYNTYVDGIHEVLNDSCDESC